MAAARLPQTENKRRRDWAPHEVPPLLRKDAKSAPGDSPQGVVSHRIGYRPACLATHGRLWRPRGEGGAQLPHKVALLSGAPDAPVHTGRSSAGPDSMEWKLPSAVHRQQ